ncbi:MAG: universal stress protein [Myxococcales bacterium]
MTSELQSPPEGLSIRHILVCLDRSPLSEACLPHAASFAKIFGSSITLLHVMQPSQNGGQTTDAFGWEIARREATAWLEHIAEQVAKASGKPVDFRLEQGNPAERITALTRELAADLTLLGSRGEGGAAAWNLGSTVEHVLGVARGSVFVVHPASVNGAGLSPKRILVPLDGSIRSESVLPTAVQLANAFGAEVVLSHVVLEPRANEVLREPEDLKIARNLAIHLESCAARYLEHLRDRLVHQLAAVRAVVLRNADERQSLLDLSRREHVDLIVLSAHGSSCNPARLYGSVAEYMLTHSTIPLLVLQDLPEAALQAPEEAAPPLRASFTAEPG